VAPHEGRESRLVPVVEEAEEQLSIRQPRLLLGKRGATEVPDNVINPDRHGESTARRLGERLYHLSSNGSRFLAHF
jgi:hypothetical protein